MNTKCYLLRYIALAAVLVSGIPVQAQKMRGRVLDAETGLPLAFASVSLPGQGSGTLTDSLGLFSLEFSEDHIPVVVSFLGYRPDTVYTGTQGTVDIWLQPRTRIKEVVVTGTLRAVNRKESPIPVEVYDQAFFKKNPSPSLFDAVSMINGVRPQINCNVCNTGDIHINGMEGPYTLVLIDGMPIVSGLSTVYGLQGIPTGILKQLEVVKGPAASLYGSEAMGGIINVITREPGEGPRVSADVRATSKGEWNNDFSFHTRISERVSTLAGLHYFNYQNPLDENKDGFTDVTLQNRLAIFNKWSFARKDEGVASLALRTVLEDRWGGQMDWNKQWSGSDSVYGEHIVTKRWELIGQYQLPVREHILAQVSLNQHLQDAFYGLTPYQADQFIAFGQMIWEKQKGKHHLLAGASFRYTYYDDNTPGTARQDLSNAPMRSPLPGVFIQEEWDIQPPYKLLLGYRYDHDQVHGGIHSPRFAFKWSPTESQTFRTSLGSGFRVVNLFTEDHAALSGARELVIAEHLEPEQSWNSNLNYTAQLILGNNILDLDVTGFYSYFSNKIVPDFESDPQKIIYRNLNGHAVSRGISVNSLLQMPFPMQLSAGISYMDVYQKQESDMGVLVREQQLFAPRWSGNFMLSYSAPAGFSFDLSGQWNGPMKLPVLPHDFRPEYSPWFCLANIQVRKQLPKGLEIYGGVKNLLNFIPKDVYMRPHDPFNKYIDDPVDNPHDYVFDTAYNYAPLQGIKPFLGIRYTLR